MPPKDPHSKAPYEAGRLEKMPKIYGDTPSFLGVKHIKPPQSLEGCDVVFMGVPWEGPVTWGSYSGCEMAVKSIRHASARYSPYLVEFDLAVEDHLVLADAGDVAVVPGDSPATMAAIQSAAGRIFASGAAPMIFGGDHSYTPAVISALAKERQGKIGIIHLDAHLDNMPEYGGDHLARCGPLYRILEIPQVRAQSVVQMGIRGPRNAPYQLRLAKERGCQLMTMRQVNQMGFDQAVEQALALAHQETDWVYLTICSDILDAHCNPGGPADFGGFSAQQLFDLARRAARAGLAGMDMVEIYPGQDPAQRSSHLAAWTFIHALTGMAQHRLGQES